MKTPKATKAQRKKPMPLLAFRVPAETLAALIRRAKAAGLSPRDQARELLIRDTWKWRVTVG